MTPLDLPPAKRAQRVVLRWTPCDDNEGYGMLQYLIEQDIIAAVQVERERCAKLFETKGPNDAWRAADAARLIRESSES